jgi:5-methylcytosine-specific restriction endonuclease McrA
LSRKEYQKQWREAHKKNRAQYGKQYYAENKAELSERAHARYLRNREKILAKQKVVYRAAPKRFIERAAKWNRENSDRHNEIGSQWSRNNREKTRLYWQNRRARIKASGGRVSHEELVALREKQRDKCAACQSRLGTKLHLDHVMPLILGGRHEIDNIQLLCRSCNSSKGGMHPEKWAHRIGRLFI